MNTHFYLILHDKRYLFLHAIFHALFLILLEFSFICPRIRCSCKETPSEKRGGCPNCFCNEGKIYLLGELFISRSWYTGSCYKTKDSNVECNKNLQFHTCKIGRPFMRYKNRMQAGCICNFKTLIFTNFLIRHLYAFKTKGKNL